MIGKQTKGRGFRGTLNYVLGKEGAEIVGGNMLGDSARELAAEFAQSRSLRPNMARAVYHASLSLPPGDHLGDGAWRDVADKYMEGMGFTGSQYVAVKHVDTPHSHIHIVASRVRLDGTVVDESHDYRRSEDCIRGLEKEFNLSRALPSREASTRAPTSGELHKGLREGQPSTKLRLQTILNQAVGGRLGMSEFLSKVERHGVEVIPNVAKTGRVTGISFRLDGELMKGSDLGRAYSWQGLQKRGIAYEQKRDFQAIVDARRRSLETGGTAKPGVIDRHTRGDSRAVGTHQIQGGGPARGGHGAHDNGIEDFRAGNGDRRGTAGKGVGKNGPIAAERRDRHSVHDQRREGEGAGSHTNLEGGPRKPGLEGLAHSGGDLNSRGARSRERLLRVAAESLRREGGSGKLGDVQHGGLSPFELERASRHRSDLRILENALKPFDDERERARKEKEEAHAQELKERRSKSKDRGSGLSR